MTDTVTHFDGAAGCDVRREGDGEARDPRLVTCLRCRWNAGVLAAQKLGPGMVTWAARVWGWIRQEVA